MGLVSNEADRYPQFVGEFLVCVVRVQLPDRLGLLWGCGQPQVQERLLLLDAPKVRVGAECGDRPAQKLSELVRIHHGVHEGDDLVNLRRCVLRLSASMPAPHRAVATSVALGARVA